METKNALQKKWGDSWDYEKLTDLQRTFLIELEKGPAKIEKIADEGLLKIGDHKKVPRRAGNESSLFYAMRRKPNYTRTAGVEPENPKRYTYQYTLKDNSTIQVTFSTFVDRP